MLWSASAPPAARTLRDSRAKKTPRKAGLKRESTCGCRRATNPYRRHDLDNSPLSAESQQSAVENAAREYEAAGWRLVPIKPGEKRPFGKGWQRQENAAPIPEGWSGSVGLLHAWSGTVCIDIDGCWTRRTRCKSSAAGPTARNCCFACLLAMSRCFE